MVFPNFRVANFYVDVVNAATLELHLNLPAKSYDLKYISISCAAKVLKF